MARKPSVEYLRRHTEVQANQAPEDQHADNYDAGTAGWIRGAGGDATRVPFFDKSNPWRKGR